MMITDEKITKTIKKIEEEIGTNRNDIYNSHLYWSQKPYNIADIIYDNLTEENDIIFDPFMGSGVTIIQSLINGKKLGSVGVEINDYPIFLITTLLNKYDIKKLKLVIDEFYNKVSNLDEIYSVYCEKCSKKNNITKSVFNIENNNYVLESVYYKCTCHNRQISKTPNIYDVEMFNKYVGVEFNKFVNFDLLENSRIAVKKNQTIYDKFTSRNIKVLNEIMELISQENEEYHDILLYSLLGIIHLSKITDMKSSSQWPLWTPNKDMVEKNVVTLYLKSLERTLKAIRTVDKKLTKDRTKISNFNQIKANNYLILKKGVQNLDENDIPSESIDLILTDPPYLGQVIYSEYMQLYKPFLKNKIDYENEIIISNTKLRGKSESLYYEEMNKAFFQISRVLKNNGIMILYFHDSNLKFWYKFNEILEENGMMYIVQTHIYKSKKTLKNIVSPKRSLNGDALLFYRKSTNNEKIEFYGDVEQKILEISKSIINNQNGKATTAELYDKGVLGFTIKSGKLKELSKKYNDFTEIFIKELNWDQKGYWTIKKDHK